MTPKQWLGIALILVALLPAIGLTFGIIPVLTGPILVILAIAGGYLVVKGSGIAKGWRLYGAIALIALAILPTFGIVLIPALVFTGPLLVILAIAAGYLLGKPGR